MMTSNPERLVKMDEQLARERASARPVVAQLQKSIDSAWDTPFPDSWRTAGMVEELTVAGANILEQTPTLTRSLAQFAVAVATSIPANAYPATVLAYVEARAWRELGSAHRYLSEYSAALRALDAAQRALARVGALAHEEAIVELSRANVLTDLGRHDEALSILEQIIPLLVSFDDEQRLAQSALLKGMVHYRRKGFALARVAFEEALAAAGRGNDLHTLAVSYNNLGHTWVMLGNDQAAAQALQKARDLFLALDMPAELTRADWGLGRILLNQGEYGKAIPILRSVRERFLKRQMVEEAGIAALDLVDALVASDDRESARVLTETVLHEFRAATLSERALTAVSYLRDLLAAEPAPRRSVQHVRTYLERLREEPAAIFLPPPE